MMAAASADGPAETPTPRTQRIPYRAITQAINLVIHIARAPVGRRIQEVCRVTGREGDTYVLEACVEGQAVGGG